MSAGKTVDIVPQPAGGAAVSIWSNPMVVGMLVAVGVSVLLNIILLVMYLAKN